MAPTSSTGQAAVGADLRELMWSPVAAVGDPPWESEAALGWFVGSHGAQRAVSHSGADPGFGSRVVLLPDRRLGVVVLANSNTVPTSDIATAALDVALTRADPATTAPGEAEPAVEGRAALRSMLPPLVGPVADALVASGPDAAAATFRRLEAAEPVEHDLDDEELTKAVWGAIELHRTSLVWPLLRVWAGARPDSSEAWTMTGWACQVDGDLDRAERHLRRALELDPGNGDAALLLSRPGP